MRWAAWEQRRLRSRPGYRDESRFAAAVVGESAGQFDPIETSDRDHVATMELALHLKYTDRKKALPTFANLQARAFVNDHRAAHLQVIPHPLFARSTLWRGCEQRRSDRFTGRQSQQHIRLATPGDDGAGAAARRSLCGKDLREHSAAAERRPGAACHGF